MGLVMSLILLSDSQASDTKTNPVLEVINTRKSVRNFTKDTLSKAQLSILVKAGMAAPTAMNRQPWAFIVVTDRKILDSLAEKLPYAKMLKTAPAAIIVCGNMDKVNEPETDKFWIMDCSAATENILLAAHSLGLGSVWTAVYPDEDRINSVKMQLGIPESIIPLNVIPIGYPDDDSPVKNKWKDENIHWEKW